MFNIIGTPTPLDELESRTLNHGRFYKIEDIWVPSVTTVVGLQSKQGILDWEKRVGYTEAERVRRAASWRGSWLSRSQAVHGSDLSHLPGLFRIVPESDMLKRKSFH